MSKFCKSCIWNQHISIFLKCKVLASYKQEKYLIVQNKLPAPIVNFKNFQSPESLDFGMMTFNFQLVGIKSKSNMTE